MKKSNFVAMIMGTIGGILFAIGMCMCLLPEWEAFTPGVTMGSIGAFILLLTLMLWRKMEGKSFRLTGKTIGLMLFGIAGSLLLGVGMCLTMVWSSMIPGILIGIVGIVMLLSLIPIIKGVKKTDLEARV